MAEFYYARDITVPLQVLLLFGNRVRSHMASFLHFV